MSKGGVYALTGLPVAGIGCLTASCPIALTVKCGRDASESKRWHIKLGFLGGLSPSPSSASSALPPSRQGPRLDTHSLFILPHLHLDTMHASIAVVAAAAALAQSARAQSSGQPLVSNAPLGEFQTVGNSIASAQQVRSYYRTRPR